MTTIETVNTVDATKKTYTAFLLSYLDVACQNVWEGHFDDPIEEEVFKTETPEQALALAREYFEKGCPWYFDGNDEGLTIAIHDHDPSSRPLHSDALAVWKNDKFLLLEAAHEVVTTCNPQVLLEVIRELEAMIAKVKGAA